MATYNANPTLWWQLLNEFSNFLIDITAAPVASTTDTTFTITYIYMYYVNQPTNQIKKNLSWFSRHAKIKL